MKSLTESHTRPGKFILHYPRSSEFALNPPFPWQRLFYSQLKRFGLSLSYPKASRLCLTHKKVCFTSRDSVLTHSTTPVLPQSQISQYYRPSVQKETAAPSTKNSSAETQFCHNVNTCLTPISDPVCLSKQTPLLLPLQEQNMSYPQPRTHDEGSPKDQTSQTSTPSPSSASVAGRRKMV